VFHTAAVRLSVSRKAADHEVCSCSCHTAENGFISLSRLTIPGVVPSVGGGLSNLGCEQGKPEHPRQVGRVDLLRSCKLLDRAERTQPSSMPCQRWARARAFTSVLSTRAGYGESCRSWLAIGHHDLLSPLPWAVFYGIGSLAEARAYLAQPVLGQG
jgi:hypothetical protein